MIDKRLRSRLLRSTMLTGFAAAAVTSANTAAIAQDDEATDEVFVTGSRLARKDFIANSPVTTIGQEAIELAGVTNVEALLNELPQVVPGLSNTSNNPGNGGQATVDLRGLGSQRTLVLINGRRLSPSDKQGIVDLNVIPASLVERVEVVTGGASAVYGSDALAGVVNFILKNDFEGVEIGAQGAQSQESDATEYTVDVTIGGNFDSGRGNAVLYVSYYDRQQVLQGSRDFSKNALFNSSRTVGGTLENSLLNSFGNNPACPAPATNCATRYSVNPDASGVARGTQGGYNFAPPNALILPADRITVGTMANYDITDDINFYAEVLYTDSRTGVQLAPAPLSGSNRVTVPVETSPGSGIYNARVLAIPGLDALLASRTVGSAPDPFAPVTVQRRMEEVGPRIQTFNKKFLQTTFGFKGTVFGDWDWNVYYSFARAEQTDVLFNDMSKARLQNALNSCPAGSAAGCTEIQIWGQGSITAAQADHIRHGSVTDLHVYEQQILSGFVAGDLFELPAGPLAVAIGAEYRQDEIKFTPADASQGDLIGFNAVQPSAGKTDVREIYIETLVPLVADLPFAQYAGLELGYRYSDYSSVGETTAWKALGEWQPIDDIRFRIGFQQATRAPSVFELFQAGDQNFPRYTDPCNSVGGVGVTGAISELCAFFGLPVAVQSTFTQSDTQVEAFRSGNPLLDEEKSDTFTFGAVITPTFVPWGNLQMSIDYYKIEIEDFIGYQGVGGAAGIIAKCFASATPGLGNLDPICSQIPQRLPSGDMAGIDNFQSNVSQVETAGIDIQVDYSADLEEFGIPLPGGIDFTLLTTYLDSYEFDGNEYKGIHYGLGLAFPEWRLNMRTTYSVNDWQFSWQMERIGELNDYGYSTNYAAYYPYVDPVFYHDIAIRWFVTENVETSLIIENVADKQPPVFVAGFVAGPNTDASLYDVVGRYFRFGVRAKF